MAGSVAEAGTAQRERGQAADSSVTQCHREDSQGLSHPGTGVRIAVSTHSVTWVTVANLC